MADYAVGRTGGSLRDALTAYQPGAVYPSNMFPPATGAEPTGSPSVPIPQPRPPQPVPLPPGGVNMPMNLQEAQALQALLQAQQQPQPLNNVGMRNAPPQGMGARLLQLSGY